MNEYWEKRKGLKYYKKSLEYAKEYVPKGKTVLDVGSGGCEYIQWYNWIPEKWAIDLKKNPKIKGVKSKIGDYMEMEWKNPFDLVICLQVLEHHPDPKKFFKKLIEDGRYVIISLPYKWRSEKEKEHIHDPIDEKKILEWTCSSPIKSEVVNDNGGKRIVSIYKGTSRENKKKQFKNYQDIPVLGIKGQRSIEDRVKYFDKNDFKNSSVLDLGCNEGQMSFQSIEWGSSRVLGVEYDDIPLLKAVEHNKQLEYNIKFIVDDLDNFLFWNSIGRYDVVLFLSVYGTRDLKCREGILSRVCQKTKKVMYFEGHNYKPDLPIYIDALTKYTDFSHFEYRGRTDRNRPFIRCSRETISPESCAKILSKPKYNKIAIVGKRTSGKTKIRDKLRSIGDPDGYMVIDDGRLHGEKEKVPHDQIKKQKKIIMFGWNCLRYHQDIDQVFFVTRDGEDSLRRRNLVQKFVHSPPGSMKNIKYFQVVKHGF